MLIPVLAPSIHIECNDFANTMRRMKKSLEVEEGDTLTQCSRRCWAMLGFCAGANHHAEGLVIMEGLYEASCRTRNRNHAVRNIGDLA
jgi:hypothetical protein